jgi:hypothetical protein
LRLLSCSSSFTNANSRFRHQPDAEHRLEGAYHRVDAEIQKVADLVTAVRRLQALEPFS